MKSISRLVIAVCALHFEAALAVEGLPPPPLPASETIDVDVYVFLDNTASSTSNATWEFDSANKNVTSGTGKSTFPTAGMASPGNIKTPGNTIVTINFNLRSKSIGYCEQYFSGGYTTTFGINATPSVNAEDGLSIFQDGGTAKGTKIADPAAPSSSSLFYGQTQYNESRKVSVVFTTVTSSPDFLYGLTVFCKGNKVGDKPIKFSTDPRIRNGGGTLHPCSGSGQCRN